MATTTKERIITLDIVRGFAVMGILAMNIYAMASPGGTYFNPLAHGTDGPPDWFVWGFNFVLVDSKMRGLFSILFGASTLLVISKAQASDRSPLKSHYARMLWLLVFGLLHFYFIWWGDILALYAQCGLVIYLWRNTSAKVLWRWAIGLLTVAFLWTAIQGVGLSMMMSGEIESGSPEENAEALSEIEHFFGADPKYVEEDLAHFGSDYATIMGKRTGEMATAPFEGFLQMGFETIGLMLLGMALFRSGFLVGDWARERYRKWALVTFSIGIPATAALAYYQYSTGFDVMAIFNASLAWSMPFDVAMAVGWAAIMILWAKSGTGGMRDRIAATGRMAFTNYLATSIIMTTVFYGYGLGLYGELNRAALYLVVIAMWALMLLWSKPWLDRFNYGPMEWLWRSLSRFSLQPMRKQTAA